MNTDQASEQFVSSFRTILARDTKVWLEKIRDGRTTRNPFTGKETFFEHKVIHDKLAAAGLLDDTEFTTALATWALHVAESPLWAVLTSHDGAWLFDDGSHLELRLKDGPTLGHLHGALAAVDPPTW